MRRRGATASAERVADRVEDGAIYDNATHVSAEAISLPTPGRALGSDDSLARLTPATVEQQQGDHRPCGDRRAPRAGTGRAQAGRAGSSAR